MLFSFLLNLLCDDIRSKVQDDDCISDLKMKKRNLKKKTKKRKEWSGMTWNYFHLGDLYLFLFCFCRCLLVRHTNHHWRNFYRNLHYCCRVCQRKCLHRSAIWYLASSVSQIHWWSSHHSNCTKWSCCIPPVCVCMCVRACELTELWIQLSWFIRRCMTVLLLFCVIHTLWFFNCDRLTGFYICWDSMISWDLVGECHK